MATREAINIQCIEQVERIESRIYELTGLDLTPMPRTHKDRDMLRLQQLRNIADWLDRVPAAQPDNRLEKALALVQSSNWTKAEMEDALTESTDDGNPDD